MRMLKAYCWMLPVAVLFCHLSMAHAMSRIDVSLSDITRQAPGLDQNVLALALQGFEYAKSHHVVNRNILTVVDYTKPSIEKRMWVINLDNHQVLMGLRVAHGKNSGLDRGQYFSNRLGSDQSSLGVYAIGSPYQGKHGLSLRLNGLEPGLNDKVAERAVVIHPAYYMTDRFVSQFGRTGRSWGCFAVDPSAVQKLITYTKNGTVLFAYAPAEKHDPDLRQLG